MIDLIERKKAIDIVNAYKRQIDPYPRVVESLEKLPSAQPEPQNDSDRIYAMMKDYYFEHKDEHDVSWQGGFGKCMNLIPNVIEKKAQPEPQWIPCSERLPEEETDVLVTRTFLGCKDGSHGWNNHIPPSIYVEVAQYFDGEWTALSDEYKVARSKHTDPIAWMPLPSPYRAERRTDG